MIIAKKRNRKNLILATKRRNKRINLKNLHILLHLKLIVENILTNLQICSIKVLIIQI